MNKRMLVGIVGGLAVLLVAGGLMASNMGFKLNYVLDGTGTNNSKTGTNTIALPFNQQTNLNDAFDLGQDMGGFGSTIGRISRYDRTTDGLDNYTASGPAFPLVPGEAYFVQLALGVPSLNYIIVGSHDPGLTLQFDGVGTNGSRTGTNFYAYPYHSTAANADELVQELGGFGVVSVLSRFDRMSDGRQNYTGSGPAFLLEPGKGYFVQVNVSQPSIQFVPSHY